MNAYDWSHVDDEPWPIPATFDELPKWFDKHLRRLHRHQWSLSTDWKQNPWTAGVWTNTDYACLTCGERKLVQRLTNESPADPVRLAIARWLLAFWAMLAALVFVVVVRRVGHG